MPEWLARCLRCSGLRRDYISVDVIIDYVGHNKDESIEVEHNLVHPTACPSVPIQRAVKAILSPVPARVSVVGIDRDEFDAVYRPICESVQVIQ